MSLATFATVNIVGWFPGDTIPIQISVKTFADSGVAYDLTGCGLEFIVYTGPGSTTELFSREIGSGIAITSLAGGTALVSFTSGQSSSMKRSASYPLKIVFDELSRSDYHNVHRQH
jgi:hypothetical protein